jgi:drug/metabolite transporter (DMT)-like permease
MDLPGWTAAIYLGIAGGALAFILWVLALERASPTLVANTMTVNPIAASLLAAQLLNEPITVNLGVGLIAVIAGILIATTSGISPVSRDPASAPLSAKPMRPRRPT